MRLSIRSTLAAVAATATVVLTTGCMMFMRPPAASEFGRTRVGNAGIYRATIAPAGDTIPQGVLQQWTLHVETVAGTPVDSATITVDGGMPQHGHGLPTKPLVTTVLGNGDHLVEGLKFHMGGWWVVKFRVASAAGADTVAFNLKL